MFLKRHPSNLYVEWAFRTQKSPAKAPTIGMLINSARYSSVKSVVMAHCSISGQRKPRKGFKRVVGTHARDDAGWQIRRYRVITVELPVRIIGRKQEHPVRTDHLDDIRDAGRIGRSIEGLR